MNEPTYWHDLHWTAGWDNQQPAVVATSKRREGSPSREVENRGNGLLVRTLSETALVFGLGSRGGYETAFLDPNGDLFQRIARYLGANAAARKRAPPTGERTRMVSAEKYIVEIWGEGQQPQRKLTGAEETVLKTHLNTLREDPKRTDKFKSLYEKYGVPRNKQRPPKSGNVVITRIRVVKHPALWRKYEAARNRIGEEINNSSHGTALTTGGKIFGRSNVKFTTRSNEGISGDGSGANLPVLNPSIGEVLLMHGTRPEVIKMIAGKGFDPKFNKGTKQGGVIKYGALGQGTYFGDSFAKVQTYTGCPICSALKCECADERGEPVERMLILARCLLGIPTKARTHDSHRKEDASTIKDGKHSVIGQERGLNSWTLYGSNEFLIKQADQMYPEFVIYWHRQ